MNTEGIMLAAAAALEKCAVPCMLVGASASNYYGIPRSTMDADFVILVPHFPASTLQAALGAEFRLDPQARIETFTMATYYTLAHLHSEFAVDLFLLEDDPHGKASFDRRVTAHFGGAIIHIPTPEDLVITKLRWSQGGRRRKDIDDARGVLAVQHGKMDLAYIRHPRNIDYV